MNISKPVIIFSVDRDNPAIDAQARDQAETVMQQNGIPYRVAVGHYKGKQDRSYIVTDTGHVPAEIRRLAKWSNQESILLVDANRQARLETPDGEFVASLGPFREVPEDSTTSQDAFTYVDGRYFVAGYAVA